MIDSLIELLKQADDKCDHTSCGDCSRFSTEYDCFIGLAADHLLANGVIAPPCKVGDTVYFINRYNRIMLYKDRVYEASVSRIVITKYGVSYAIRIHGGHAVNEIPYVEFGKDFFLTREEAEQALKGEHNG